MFSPLSSSRCAYWSIRAQYHKTDFPHGWPELYKACSPGPFYVEDDTGRIMVDPEGALIDIPPVHQSTGNISGKNNPDVPNGKLDAAALKFIDGLDASIKAGFMEHKDDFIMITEMYIPEGDTIFVIGTLQEGKYTQNVTRTENLIVKKGNDILYIRNSPEKAILSEKKSLIPWQIAGGVILSGTCLWILLFTI